MRRIWIIVVVGVIVAAAAAAAALFGLRQPSEPTTPLAGSPAPATPAVFPVASAPASGSPAAASVVLTPDDHVMGKRDAPVTIIEYASLTCPHCAHFHETTLPRVKSEYIDTGKAKLVFRDFPLDEMATRAAALAECVGPDRYFGLLGILFEGQMSWATAQDPKAALARLGKVGGLSDEQVTACLNDDKYIDKVVAERLEGEKQFAIRSTPTFIINGKKFSGALTFEQIQDAVRPLLP